MSVNKCCCVLSPNKKSILGLTMRSQILYLLLISSFLAMSFAADVEVSCANVKINFERKGMLSSVDIQEQPTSDADGLCLRNGCCGAGARVRLTQQARTQLESALRSELNKLADILANRARKFDEFFRKLLQLSREEFHAMFKRTYGMIYEQHSYVFEQLFEQLERYYTRGDTDFDQMMDGFFGILYQKMFTVLNSQYSFNEQYLKCVNQNMREIQPFEDVPHKLSVQLRRAFVATRTFHKALRAGADVVRNMMQVGVTQECVTAWARLRFCGTCSGAAPPACSRYCHNVLRGCLPAHADLGDQWDAYVDAVEKVADRLLGPFNIAMVVEPIDIKISEAIMSFQEHNQEISQKIFAGCGKPVLGGGGGAGPFFPPERQRRFARAIPDFDWNQKTNDVDDFIIETSYENTVNNDFRTADGVRKATEEMEEQARSRERFLQYMRGKIDLEDYEEHERRKRDAAPEPAAASGEIDFRAYEFDGKRGGAKKKKPAVKNDDGHGAEWGGPALERLVRETRARLRSSRRYWSVLPPALCAATSVTSSPCFNGTTLASYTAAPAGDGSAALASNPEVRSIGTTVLGSTTARAQQDALKTLTARLKDAYNGVEVQWKDADDLQVASSNLEWVGSEGSGSGSGDDTDDSDQLPDDDEDRQDYPEGGSGRSPLDVDDTEDDVITRSEVAPPVSEPPIYTDGPSVVAPPNTNIIRGMGDAPPEPDEPEIREDVSSKNAGVQDIPATAPPNATNTRSMGNAPLEPEAPETQTKKEDINVMNNGVQDISVTGTDSTQPSSSAERPSLQRALYAYALPVVCAWFGTIITDLF